MRRAAPFLLASLLAGCGIYHVAAPRPESAAGPVSADAAAASSNCFEAETPAEIAICRFPEAASANRAMLREFHRGIREAGLFGRDVLLADQARWLLGLDAACHLPAAPAVADAAALACVAAALDVRRRVLAAGHGTAAGAGAIAQYVIFRGLADATPEADPELCRAMAAGANLALGRVGTVDPGAFGGEELAGSHGAANAEVAPGRAARVALYEANVFGLYQIRARGLDLGGVPAIGPLSLSELVQAQSRTNQGGRFSAYASQTGDYGAIDLFRYRGRLLGIAEDPWGSTAPAAPGEFAHAGVWDVSGTAAAPLCLFDTYEVPPGPERFDALPAFGAWRAALAEVNASAAPSLLGPAALRDASQLRADTDFVLLNMPLLALREAQAGGWTLWLRQRHDRVLDALFAWSTKSAGNKAVFDRVFAPLRPAAAALVGAYQKMEALDADEARQAAGIAMMEFLYGATLAIAPDIGADLEAPLDAAGYRPRYPVLAAPQ